MVGPDSFYTPQPLADKLVSYVKEVDAKTAIDFCVGDGDLLKAIQNRFNDIHCFGTDISSEAIDKLRALGKDWLLDVCDFCNDESIANITFLDNAQFDLIVLNPPFTCKGSIINKITFEGEEYKVSTAMMFILRAMKYLAPKGGLYAILPISCVYSQKDRAAWSYLQKEYNACVLEETQRVYFQKKCSPNIVLVYIGHQNRVSSTKTVSKIDFSSLPVDNIIRGSIRMQNPAYSRSRKALRLIHTTNIRGGKLVDMKRVLPENHQKVSGYGVVIPRVCNPNPQKVALLDGNHTYALSDCVVVLCTIDMEAAIQVRSHILNNWQSFVNVYKGTGAQYTTIERLKKMFGK